VPDPAPTTAPAATLAMTPAAPSAPPSAQPSSATPRSPALPSRSRRRGFPVSGAARAAVATVLLFAALAIFGARVHWVEEAGSAERDGYVAQAESLARGELPRDPYRPALYPLAVAAAVHLGAPPFTAARLLSNLSAAALAWLAWFVGRRLAGPPAGWLAFALTAVNPNLWILGQHVTTDMPFAALAAAALAAGLVYLEAPGWRPALAAGAALGLATFTRANALFLLPPLALAWWLAPAAPARRGDAARGSGRRWLHLAVAGGAAIVLLAPHFALRAAAFGSPFHDENWKNLAFKLYGFPDWSYLERVPFAGPWQVLAADPGRVLRGFVAELWRFVAGGGLSQLVGTPLHALLFAAGAALAVAAGGAVRRRAGWLLLAGGVFLAAVAATFFTWGRLLLVLLPLANALAAAPWGTELPGGSLRDRLRRRFGAAWLRRAAVAVAVGAVLLLAAKTFLFRLPAFVERHPYASVAALRELAAETPPGTVLAGTSPFLGRYLDRPYRYVPDAFGREVGDPALYYRTLHRRLTDAGAAYLVVDPVDLRDRPRSLLGDRPPVPWLRSPDGLDPRLEGFAPVRVWGIGQRP